MRLAVVGAGWAGLAAAVRACQAGHAVTLFEMALRPGGRARGVEVDGVALDNGQHILIGAYERTLELMRTVGVDVAAALARSPLALRVPDGRGLALPPGAPALAFLRGVLGSRGWSLAERFALLRHAARWAGMGFRCDERLTVEQLCAELPAAVRALLIDPLCVAALNTPAHEASAAVLLRVLRDALFGARGSADLLLPRDSLDTLLPAPARRWLEGRGARMRFGHRVKAVRAVGNAWRVDEAPFDGVVLACSAAQAARLTAETAPPWSARAAALRYEPIVTVYLRAAQARLPQPMMALLESARCPAQFAFDRGALGGPAGLLAFVVSGARPWVERGREATVEAVLDQARQAFASEPWAPRLEFVSLLAEKRATFRCTPGLDRPPARIAAGLVAAGDYVRGPYPATLEGAVRSAEQALRALQAER